MKATEIKTTIIHKVTQGQRKVTRFPIGFCTKYGVLHPELHVFLNFSWVIVMHHFVCRFFQYVYLKIIIVKYEDDHYIRDPLTRVRHYPIFFTN